MSESPDEDKLAQMEIRAIEFAREAGLILSRYFGTQLKVEYKDKNSRDPVTNVDTEAQEFLTKAISEHYPDHGIIGEEDKEQKDSAAPDWVWVLDPLDGTKNFLSGLPMFACSIGVLYRGAPMVGALYISWPSQAGGVVMHARKGGGAFVESERISVLQSDEPQGNLLVTLPGSFGVSHRFRKPMRGKIGEVRITGSIAYDLALTAKGALQYSITGAPRLWDVAAGAVLVTEAGGVVLVGRRADTRAPFIPAGMCWEPLESFPPNWRVGTTGLQELRQWSAPLIMGSPGVAWYIARNLRSGPRFRHRLTRAVRRLKRGATPSKRPS